MPSRLVAGLAGLLFAVAPVRAGLLEYVQKPEPEFAWKLEHNNFTATGTTYQIHLVSQTWQGVKWEHGLLVFQPKDVKPAATMLLLNTGGNPNAQMSIVGLELARRVGAPVAVLYNIPNQPLYGKKEDALIAETFVRFLNGGGKDETWPLLFPMVKSVCKAMDALQAFSKEKWQTELKDFIITGASKRGWTTWLTGGADPRVRAIAPMVIDVLNMPAQMHHQLECYGRYSEMIHDYEDRKLLPAPDTIEARKLWSLVDPYAYRDRLTMPKLIINGANDPYWTVDALNLYWNELKGDKAVIIVPNAGHNLQQKLADGGSDPVRAWSRMLSGLAAFTRVQSAGGSLPKLSWSHTTAQNGDLWLTVQSSPTPAKARLWVATSDTRDFRKSKWDEVPTEIAAMGTKAIGSIPPPATGFLAFYGELDFVDGSLTYSLATQVRVVPSKK
jgi:PhoPQ-activated pathogenicity-related protein